MSDPASPLAPVPATPEPTLESLAQGQQSLRAALHVTLIMLIILAGSLFVFFLRELSLARRQLADLTQGVAEYEKNAVPVMEDFRIKLQAYTRTHPDFAPLFTKYFGTNTAALPSPPPRAQPLTNTPGTAGARMPPPR